MPASHRTAGPEGGILCRIYFKNDADEWVWREDGAENTDIEAVKGGLSNAMKRAGSALGIGRYLYRLPQQWVRLDERGRFAETPRIPAEFLPSGTAPARPPNGAQAKAAPRESTVVVRPAPPPDAEVETMLRERLELVTDADADTLNRWHKEARGWPESARRSLRAAIAEEAERRKA